MVVEVFIPCFVDQLYPETGMNMVKILKKNGIEIKYNPNQTCCGQPAYNSGYWDEAKEVAEKFLNDFSGNNLIISPSASCAGFVKTSYPALLKESKISYKVSGVTTNMIEFCDFFVNTLKTPNLGAKLNAKVTVHDSCAARREYGLNDELRILLRNIEGISITELKDGHLCCGFGGTFSIKHSEISSAMVEQKVLNAMDTGAEYIVTTEASCLINMDGYIKKHNLPIKVIHIIDLLARGMSSSSENGLLL